METDTKKRYQSWARPSWAQSDQMIDGWVIRLLFNNTSQHIDQSNRSLPKLLEPFIHFGSNWTNRSFLNLSWLKNKRFDFNKSSTSIQQVAQKGQRKTKATTEKKTPSENTFNFIETSYKFFTHWLFTQIIDFISKTSELVFLYNLFRFYTFSVNTK